MASLLYETIESVFLRKVTDYDFLELTDENLESQIMEYLHSAISKVYVRRLFSSVTFDDIAKELTYSLKQSTDEEQDNDFVTEMLALGMVIEWVEPLKNSKLTMKQMITSSKESKWYSQAQHISAMQNAYDSAVKTQRDLIRDRGYIYNSYLGETNG